MRTQFLAILTFTISVACTAAPPVPNPDPAGVEFFEKNVRPVFAARCLSCHGGQKQSSSLRLDSLAAVIKGGDMGSELTVGDPEKSRIVVAIRQTTALKMPPGEKCTDKEIEAIAAWVKMGAPWPVDAKPVASTEDKMRAIRKSHWSLQPVKRPAVPSIKHPERAVNAIDRFILAEIDKSGLKSAKPASKETLIRRATFDLTGLPATPDDVKAFVSDNSPDAYSKLIDHLLASPHYGERWARQWLDLARYSDTLGYLVGTSGRRYPYAYTYRDYVIRALNEDKPYDQFLLEQLAADQLSLKDKRDLAALGFITVGNRYLGDQQEIIDDRIDVVGRGLQGLTLGCARCHSHKFDPVPIEDYYSLYSIFNNGHEPETPPQIAETTNKSALAAYETKLKSFDARMADAKKKKDDGAADTIRRELLDFKATDPGAPPCAMAYYDNDKPAEQKVFLRGSASNLGPPAPARFLLAVDGDARKPYKKGSGRLELAQSIASTGNPLTARVMVNRIWLGHFGKAIVRTPSDFGIRGELPTNPALLDWLASEFMAGPADGSRNAAWSIKKMHRLIMLSATYQKSADGDPKTVQMDPENRLCGRMNRRRLDFEEMRDSMLAVSGTLDSSMFGQPVDWLEKSRRRTLYTFIDRQAMPGLMRAFDFPDANQHAAQRSNTTVPQQSLFLLNGTFVQSVAHSLTTRGVVMEAPDTRSRAAQMLRLVTSREPEPRDVDLAERFITRMQKSPPPAIQPLASAWSYGYGELETSTGRLKSFTPMPKFNGTSWQGGDKLPDPVIGWVSLHTTGGHPGDKAHSAVRRWTARENQIVDVTGSVNHPSPNGDGVLAAIVQNGNKCLLSNTVAHTTLPVEVRGISVRAGDTLDFVIDCRENNTSDSFEWSPTITVQHGQERGGIKTVKEHAYPTRQWNAAADFSGPYVPTKAPDPWDIYAQALFLTNSFLFID